MKIFIIISYNLSPYNYKIHHEICNFPIALLSILQNIERINTNGKRWEYSYVNHLARAAKNAVASAIARSVSAERHQFCMKL